VADDAAAKKSNDTPRDQAERVLNLLAILSDSSAFLTQEEIGHATKMYGPDDRANFERDKAVLRDMGIPIESKTLGGSEAGKMAYRIDRRQMELGNINFTDAERRALQVALAAVHIDTSWADRAGLKLGLDDADLPVVPVVNLPVNSELLPVLADAVSRCVSVKFPYTGGQERSINPYGLLSRAGHWYVVGHDHMREAVRSFRVDRIAGDITLTDDLFERPEGFDIEAAVATDAQMLRETGADSIARVLIDADLAPSVVREFGDDCVVERRSDGAVVVEVPCGNRPAFRSWVLGLVAGAEVLSPPEARADIVDWLNAIAGVK